MKVSAMVHGGPTIGPYNSFKEELTSVFLWGMECMKQSASHQVYLDRFIPSLNLFLESMISTYKPEEEEKYYICHRDLNASNILVDQKTLEITGVLDWEWAACCLFDQEWNFNDWLEDEQGGWMLNQELEKIGISAPIDVETREPLFLAMNALTEMIFSVSTWFHDTPPEEVDDIIADEVHKASERLKDVLKASECWIESDEESNK